MAKEVQGWIRDEDVCGRVMLMLASLMLAVAAQAVPAAAAAAAMAGSSGSSRRMCRTLVAGSANGCSIPLQLPFFYKDRFTPACNRHDVCYGCGSLYRLNRGDCDQAFLRDMMMACSNHKPSPARGRRHATPRHHHYHPAPLPTPLPSPSPTHQEAQPHLPQPSSAVEQEENLQRVFRRLFMSGKNAAILQSLLDKTQGQNSSSKTPVDEEEASLRSNNRLERLISTPHFSPASSSRKGFEELHASQNMLETIPGYSRSRFIRRMRSERRKRQVTWCQTFARNVYFPTVQVFGSTHFSMSGQTGSYCPQQWVSSCLPPTRTMPPPFPG